MWQGGGMFNDEESTVDAIRGFGCNWMVHPFLGHTFGYSR